MQKKARPVVGDEFTEHMCHNKAMLVRKAYKLRLYPNKEQQTTLAVQFGHARFVYNHFLQVGEITTKQAGKD
jgi:putative transposase